MAQVYRDPLRRSQLAAIHTAKKALGLDDETYRDYLEAWTGKRSAADMRSDERARVIEHLRKLGFERQADRVRILPDDTPQEQLIKKLWMELYRRKAAKADTTAALNAWVKRMTGIDNYRWLTPEDGVKVIESLKQWLGRLKK